MSGVILGALAKISNERHRDLANNLVLNAYRLDSCNKIFEEIREIPGTKKYMNQESLRRREKEKAARARKERRAIPRDRSRRRPIPRGRSRSSSLATVGCAGNQATRSRSAGTTRTRSRRPMLQRRRLRRASRLNASIAGSRATDERNVQNSRQSKRPGPHLHRQLH